MACPIQRCAVTGASGYVGSRICNYFSARDWTVFELSRRPRQDDVSGRFHIPFELDAPPSASVFRDNRLRVLIHCAYDFRATQWNTICRRNVDGSSQLLRNAVQGGVETIVVLSSISAFDGCRSMYGKAKLSIERAAADVDAFIVRPGLVYGSGSPV
jgi:nucleoside-diphosphate-sugar epimerase